MLLLLHVYKGLYNSISLRYINYLLLNRKFLSASLYGIDEYKHNAYNEPAIKKTKEILKMFKKIFAALLATTLIAGSLSISSVSAVENNETNSDTAEIKTITPIIKNNITTYYDQDGKEVDPTLLNADVEVEKKLPSSYDLRDYGRSTSVKDQGNLGLCWDFASTASMESNILTQGLNNETADTLDLSEAGNSWYLHTNTKDTSSSIHNEYVNDPAKGTTGANSMFIADSLSSGYGAYPESMLEYESYSTGYPESMRFYSDYRLKDYVELDTTNTDLIKQRIMDFGAAYYTYDSQSEYYSYTDDGKVTFYDSNKSGEPAYSGHAVTIIGWDDNFSKENFGTENQPENDGAWLIKNSWGEVNPFDDPEITPDENYVGYFWASYESEVYEITQFEVQKSDKLENIYQHQVSALEYAEVDSAANIFTAKSTEELKQICFGNTGEVDANVSIYKLNENYSSPVDGKLLASFDANIDYTGTHMVECPDGIILNEGDVFSVVIDSDDKLYIKCKSEIDSNSEDVFGKSYIAINDNTWVDVAEDVIDTSYAAIKAYTSNVTVDKSQLNQAIEETSDFTADKNVPQSEIDEFNAILESAKKVASDENASQISINNAYCVLKGKYEELNHYCFHINSIEDFLEYSNSLRNDNSMGYKYVSLNTDLDLSGYVFDESINGDKTFTGTFDGNGHTIKNFTIAYSRQNSYGGLFAYTNNAIIKDVTFDNAHTNGTYGSGVISTVSSNTQFINCTVKNSVSIGDDAYYASVMAGASNNCTFTNCTIENSIASGANAETALFSVDVSSTNIYENCTATDYEVKSTESITDNMGFEVYFKNSSESTVGINSYVNITVTDDKCTIKELVGELESLVYGYRPLTAENGIYTIDKYIGTAVLYGKFAESENYTNFYSYPDLINEGVVLTGYGNPEATSIEIPTEILGAPVIGISDSFSAAPDPTQFTSLTIPSCIKTIPDNAFCELTNLETVIIEDGVEEIGNNAFKGCNLKQITLPDSIRTIGDYAFATCPSTSVVLGKNIEKIGTHAFGYTGHKTSGGKDLKIENFVVNGYAGTPAEEYAKSNGFTFVDLTTQQAVIPETSYDYSSYLKGDVNLDGEVNIADATLIQKYLVGTCELNEIQLSNALTGDSTEVSISDATRIMQYTAGIIESL